MNSQIGKTILEKTKCLRPEHITESEALVDFLKSRDPERRLTRAASALAEESLRKSWDNMDDADYDRL